MVKRKLYINPNYNPKPITEGEVWQGNPFFPNELRDSSEKFLITEEEYLAMAPFPIEGENK